MSFNTRKNENSFIIGWEENGYKERSFLFEGKTDDEVLTEIETFLNEKKAPVADAMVERAMTTVKNQLKNEEV